MEVIVVLVLIHVALDPVWHLVSPSLFSLLTILLLPRCPSTTLTLHPLPHSPLPPSLPPTHLSSLTHSHQTFSFLRLLKVTVPEGHSP